MGQQLGTVFLTLPLSESSEHGWPCGVSGILTTALLTPRSFRPCELYTLSRAEPGHTGHQRTYLSREGCVKGWGRGHLRRSHAQVRVSVDRQQQPGYPSRFMTSQSLGVLPSFLSSPTLSCRITGTGPRGFWRDLCCLWNLARCLMATCWCHAGQVAKSIAVSPRKKKYMK